MKKKFRISLKVARCPLVFHPDFPPGVFITQEVSFQEPEKGREWQAADVLQHQVDTLLKEEVEVIIEPITEN